MCGSIASNSVPLHSSHLSLPMPSSHTVPSPGGGAREAEDWLQRGKDRMDAFDFEGAVAAFSQGIALNPSDNNLYTERSQAYAKMNRISEALKDAMAVWQGGPKLIATHVGTSTYERARPGESYDNLKRDPRIPVGSKLPTQVDGDTTELQSLRQEKKQLIENMNQMVSRVKQSKDVFLRDRESLVEENQKLRHRLASLGLLFEDGDGDIDSSNSVEQTLEMWKDIYDRYPFLKKDEIANALARHLSVLGTECTSDRERQLQETLHVKEEELKLITDRLNEYMHSQVSASRLVPKLEEELGKVKEALRAKEVELVRAQEALAHTDAATETDQTKDALITSLNSRLHELEANLAAACFAAHTPLGDTRVAVLEQKLEEMTEERDAAIMREKERLWTDTDTHHNEMQRYNKQLADLHARLEAKEQQVASLLGRLDESERRQETMRSLGGRQQGGGGGQETSGGGSAGGGPLMAPEHLLETFPAKVCQGVLLDLAKKEEGCFSIWQKTSPARERDCGETVQERQRDAMTRLKSLTNSMLEMEEDSLPAEHQGLSQHSPPALGPQSLEPFDPGLINC